MLLVLGARLTQLQGFTASKYAQQAAQQRTRTITLPAARGVIMDRDGQTLAQDMDARAVYADPAVVSDPAAEAAALASLLKIDRAELQAKMTKRTRFIYLARGLDPTAGAAVGRLRLPGVFVVEERRRTYPSHSVASNVVGFTRLGDSDTLVGNGGIELAYDNVLRGRDGVRRQETDPSGRQIPAAQSVERDPVAGSAIRLTIDRDIQWDAQTAIAAQVAATQADGGTIVVMNPHTGDILAMADAPQFDPNNVGSADPRALGNRSTGAVYEPGSVNKVITMAAAIDRGLITPSTPVTVPPRLERGGRPFVDAEPHGTEHLTAAGVLAHSSNIGTILISEQVGTAKLEQTMRAFGLGARTALGFPGESRGLLPASPWSATQSATIPYGQGMSATALQMASVYATVANGGVRVAPRLVDAVGAAGGTVRPVARTPGTRVVSARTAAALTQMLEAVATDAGTAPAAEVPGYRVAGKTGTANRVDPSCGCYQGYVSSFIGFAPADDPQVVVEVVLDNPKNGHFGGQVAAPVFQRVMTFALASLGVAPAGTKPPNLVLDLDPH
jgi:cell division protein FtsI (penicillin-binding protein 3)